MRFLNMLFGGLLGAVPGVLLIAIGQIVTDGGEVMLEIGFGGVLLSVVGLIVGLVLGWKRSGWLNGQGVLGAAIGLMAGVILWQLVPISWDLEIVALVLVAGSLLGGFTGNRMGSRRTTAL